MGEIIRRQAAVEDIIMDVRTTLTNATAKGGKWKTLADARLEEVIALVERIEARLAQATKALGPISAALNARNDEADRLLGRVSDEIWNEVGRPAADPALTVLFPGGIAYYADGNVEDQPDRMELLAIKSVHLSVSSLAKLCCPFKYRVEDWCEVARRTGDDLKHLQRRCLLLPCLAQFAGKSCDFCTFA